MLSIVCYASAQQAAFAVPQQQTFNDPQSALNDKSNLQSRSYQDFIQTLYRFDADSLHRANNLFESAGTEAVGVPRYDGNQRQPTYADYLQSQQQQQQPQQQQFAGKQRNERDAMIVRPLFVYRLFQEMENRRAEDRAMRRFYKYRKAYNKNFDRP